MKTNVHILRANITIEMDRPIEKEKHYISPGGYEVVTDDGTSYGFDFHRVYGNVDTDLPNRIHFECCEIDTETFPDANKLCQVLEHITTFPEAYVYTGEEEDPEIHVQAIRSFALEISVTENFPVPEDTPYITFESVGVGNDRIVTCTFTDRLLKTIENYPNS
mgnify:CR=1 FL=1|jgi:hypothetical protein